MCELAGAQYFCSGEWAFVLLGQPSVIETVRRKDLVDGGVGEEGNFGVFEELADGPQGGCAEDGITHRRGQPD